MLQKFVSLLALSPTYVQTQELGIGVPDCLFHKRVGSEYETMAPDVTPLLQYFSPGREILGMPINELRIKNPFFQ